MAIIPTIHYSNLSNYSISSSVVTTTTANLLNYFSDSLWISPNSNDQNLYITFNSIKTCNYFLIDPFNTNLFGPNAKLTLSASDNATFTSGTTTGIYKFSLSSTNINNILLIKFPTSISKQYWKIELSSMNVSPSAGNIFIDNSLIFTTAYDFGYKTEDSQYDTTEFISLNGKIRTNQNYAGRLIYDIKFSLQDDTLKSAYQSFMQSIRGKLRPFYFADTNIGFTTSAGIQYYSSGNLRYMHLDSDYSPISVRRYGVNDLQGIRLKSKYANF